MSNSLKEFHLAESQQAPTSLEIPTMVSLKTIETIDEMLEHQNLDIESLCKQVLDVKKTLLNLDYKASCFRDHAVRLLSLVKYIA